jgi:ketosteroid isomerase-like protein
MIMFRRSWILAVVLSAGFVLAQGDRDLAALEAWVADEGQRYLELYADGDIEGIVEVFSDDFRMRDVTGDVYVGRDAYVAVVGGYHEAGARLSAEGPHDLGFLADDVAFSIWSWTFSTDAGDVLAEGESLYLYHRAGDGAWEWVMQFSAPMVPEE